MMDRNVINKHNFVLTGFALVFIFFGVVLFHEYSSDVVTQSVIGYVVLEEGVRVSVDKMDEALVKEISQGDENPRVVVVLDEGVAQEDFLNELQDNIIVEEQVVIGLSEKGVDAVSPLQIVEENNGVFSFLDKKQEADFEVTEKFESGDAVAGEVKSADALIELTQNRNVKKIYLDYPVSVDLDESVKQINASTAWGVVVNGSAIQGSGKSVCVIDTGVDYTLTALGGCTPSTYELNGQVSAFNGVASSHPYNDGSDVTYIVQKEGFSSIAVHFSKIELEQISSAGDTTDRIYIYDGLNRTVAIYKGVVNDVWSPAVAGDTLYVRLVTDGSVTGYGFQVDQVINGTTNVSMDWASCSKVIGGYDVYNNDADPKDDQGHGTHVAGIIGSTDAVYKGVAPEVGIVALKALSGSGSGYASDVLAAIEWCTSNADKFNISVISMSLGCDGGSCPHYQTACDDDLLAGAVGKAVERNIMVTIASGNSGWTDGISSPSCISSAIPVGGVNGNDQVVYNRGQLLHVLAPAQGIISTMFGNQWRSSSGTSMATPHVAGAIVLLQDYVGRINGTVLGVGQMKQRLFDSGKVVVDSGSGLNFSRVDVYAMLGIVNVSLGGLENSSNTNSTTGNLTNSSVALRSIVIISPQNNTVVRESVLLNVSIIGNVTIVEAGYELWSNNLEKMKNKSVSVSGLGLLNYTFSEIVNLSQLVEGKYNLKSFSVDVINVSQTANVTFIVDKTAPQIGVVVRNNSNVTINDSVMFSVLVDDSVLNVNNVLFYYAINGSVWVNKSMRLSSGNQFNVTINSSAWLANVSVQYYVSAVDLAGNYNFSVVENFTVQEVNSDVLVVPLIAFNVTSPLNGSVMEVGGLISYNIEGLGVNDSVVWLFGDGMNSTLGSGEKQFNSTGNFMVQLLHRTNGTSKGYNRSVIVNDTLGPTISDVNFASVVDYSKNISQIVSVGLFDYSGISLVNLTLSNQSFNGNCTNGTIHKSCYWNINGTSLGSKEFLIMVKDGYGIPNQANITKSFIVTACKDSVKNGDEMTVDCGGSCGVCANNTSTNVTAAMVVPLEEVVPLVVEQKEEVKSSVPEVKAPVAEIKKAEQAVVVSAQTEGKSTPAVNGNMSLSVPEEIVNQEVEKKYTVLYILGTLVAGLAGLYVFMMREGL